MEILLVTDIFGRSGYTDYLSEAFTMNGFRSKVIDPFSAQIRNFTDEDEVYQVFMESCGHSQYTHLVKSALSSITSDIIIIGFSAGASATWKAVSELNDRRIQHFLGFYPSQIRNHQDLDPSCPTTLLFPEQESHFCVDNLIQKLSEKRSVVCFKTPWQHGFMNPLSRHYSQTACTAITEILLNQNSLSHRGKLQISLHKLIKLSHSNHCIPSTSKEALT